MELTKVSGGHIQWEATNILNAITFVAEEMVENNERKSTL